MADSWKEAAVRYEFLDSVKQVELEITQKSESGSSTIVVRMGPRQTANMALAFLGFISKCFHEDSYRRLDELKEKA